MSWLVLFIPSFLAGVLTFLAPCTLPLVPGYLMFIGGVSSQDALRDPEQVKRLRGRIFRHALLFVAGFTLIFVMLGTVFTGIISFWPTYRDVLQRIAGVFIFILGIFMMGALEIPWLRFLDMDRRIHLKHLTTGTSLGSFLFGATYALGWSPCIGPTLGTALLLASVDTTMIQGAALLFAFSMGLAVPFLLSALLLEKAMGHLKALSKHLHAISLIGGFFIALMGVLLMTGMLDTWIGWTFRFFSGWDYEGLMNYF